MNSTSRWPSSSLPIIVWGTYDVGKPRVRILLRGLKESGIPLVQQHTDVWRGVEDKSQIKGSAARLWRALIWLSAYPGLIIRYCFAPKHELVLLPYMSHLDVLVIWPIAKLKGAKIIWDVFIPLYHAVVVDRALIKKGSLAARVVYGLEWLAARTADLLFLDTRAHAAQFEKLYKLKENSVGSVPIGVEPEMFPHLEPMRKKSRRIQVLFFGQFIPLHGVGTIFEAARMDDIGDIDWTIIGAGQEAPLWRKQLSQRPIERITWLDWVEYEALIQHIQAADVCLGIFGSSEKAGVVIPNKVFQVIASGRPVVTRQSEAIDELPERIRQQITVVPPNDPVALLKAIRRVYVANMETDIASAVLEINPKAVSNYFVKLVGERFKGRFVEVPSPGR